MKITSQEQLDEFCAGVREREAHAARKRALADPDRINRRIERANISENLKDNLRLMFLFDQIEPLTRHVRRPRQIGKAMTSQTPDKALATLREKAKAEGGFTDYSCPICGDIFWGGFCQCPDNTYRCEKCGYDESRCTCYPGLDQWAIESARHAIAFAQSPPWDGLSLTAERTRLAKLLGHHKAADEIMAQVRAYGHPGPRRKVTQAERANTRAWLEANCTPEELAEVDRLPSASELAEIEADAKAAHALLAKSRFGDCRWSDEIWRYIDILLGADKKSIAVAEAARNAREQAKAKEYEEFNKRFEEQFNEKYGDHE